MTIPGSSRAPGTARAVADLRIGLVGAGGIAPVHMDGWTSLGTPVTIYSTDGAPALAAHYGARTAPDLHALLDVVDVVDIVTPTSDHRDIALAAIAAGKHVVCEKPLSDSSVNAQAMVDAAEAAGVQLYPAHVVRYFPEYAAVKAAVGAGEVGSPAVLRFRREGQAPRHGTWFFDENRGGGIILDQMIHDIDQARWIAGEVTQVYAVQSPASVDGIVPSPVTAHVVLTHAGGALSHVQGVWGPIGLTFRTSVDVAGSAGTLAYRSPEDGALRQDLPAGAGAETYLPPDTHAQSPYTSEIHEFAGAFVGGTMPRVTGADGVAAVALVEAAYRSLTTGRAVEIAGGRPVLADSEVPV